MTSIHDLLEYEGSLDKGIILNEGFDVSSEETPFHYRAHKTKGGLYIVLRHHKDGRLQTYNYTGRASSKPFFDIYVSGYSVFYSLEWQGAFSPKVIGKSSLVHNSGVCTDYLFNGSSDRAEILSLNISTKSWKFEIRKDCDDVSVQGSYVHAVNYDFSKYGKVKKTKDEIDIEGKFVDYEKTILNVFELIKIYDSFDHEKLSQDQRTKSEAETLSRKLNSLDCFILN